MNYVAEEILSYRGVSDSIDDSLEHYGMPRRSGRYPWGSGEDPNQHTRDFISEVEELKSKNFTFVDSKGRTLKGDSAIAASKGMTTQEFRAAIAVCKNERKLPVYARIKSLKEDGLSPTEIGKIVGKNESTIRSILDSDAEANARAAHDAAKFIKDRIESTGKMVDVGENVERELNISKEKLDQAIYILKREGYVQLGGRVEQATNKGNSTTVKLLARPGTEKKEFYNFDEITSLQEYISRDGGKTFEKKFHYPTSIDSKRVKVLLADEIGPDGEPGIAKDGIIQLRRGVPDLSLGESRYSQVRILVDGNKYLKGMAVYSDNMPDGIDIIFNSNKTKVEDAFKKIKDDPENPFGSLIKDADKGGQYWYDDPKTGERKLGAINKRADEGDWTEWKDAIPSQFLSKQSLHMAKKQLNIAKMDKIDEFEEICSLTNPTVKKYWLNKFADECDAAAVDLKAAALPGQKYHVIIPINSLKENEIYAPGYDNGTKLALVRYPHGGTFEIPIVTVNNKHAKARELLGPQVRDAVGINSKVAERLSGADFDGDTVMCIPTHDPQGKVKVASRDNLPGLVGFDPTTSYGPHTYEPGSVRLMTKRATQTQMGIISNLITDMTLAGANDNELAAAVRHSMVVIDAEKHKLDYKRSEFDNNIAALHKKYQGNSQGGAATIVSKAKGQTTVDKRQGTPKVNMKYNKKGELNDFYDPTKPEGALIYKKSDDLYYPDRSFNKQTGEVTISLTTPRKKVTYNVNDPEARDFYEPIKNVDPVSGKVTFTNKTGEYSYRVNTRKQKSTKMAEADDAYDLVSEDRHPMELLYADYANSMKSLANQARIEMMTTDKVEYSKTAKATYINEYNSLMSKLNEAEKNAPRERLAQIKAAAEIKSKKDADPDMTSEDIRKASQRAISKYRDEVGSVARRDRSIKITESEWEAIQAGAISENKLLKILNNSDADVLRSMAMPRTTKQVTPAKANRIKSLSASNYTIKEIAKKMGLSVSTVAQYLQGGN